MYLNHHSHYYSHRMLIFFQMHLTFPTFIIAWKLEGGGDNFGEGKSPKFGFKMSLIKTTVKMKSKLKCCHLNYHKSVLDF